MKKIYVPVFLCLSLICGVSLSYSQSISFNPDNGDPGASFTVTISGVGTAFSVASTTTAKISNGTEEYTMTGSASNSTTFNATLTLPMDAPAGAYDGTIYQIGAAGTFWSCASCFTVNDACNLSVTTSVQNVDCQGDNTGSINLNVSGATNPVFDWSTGASTEDLNNLTAGVYFVTITDGVCELDTTVAVSEPSAINLTTTKNDESNMGANDGTAAVNATGGSLPYTYSWSSGQTTASITGLAGGDYFVTVTDDNGCTSIDSITINTVMCTLALGLDATQVSCNGANDGSATAIIGGGTPGYTVSWDDTTLNTITRANLAPGTYHVMITDSAGCTIGDSVNITEPPAIEAIITGTNTSNDSTADGSIMVAASNGQGSFNINIAIQEDTTTGINNPNQLSIRSRTDTTVLFEDLLPGTYDIIIMDSAGCALSSSVTISSDACVLLISATSTDNICAGDSTGDASVTITGADGTVGILWSTGSMDTMINGLVAGTYGVSVADEKGCVANDTVVLVDPTPISATVDSIVSNADTSFTIVITPSGGSGTYQFEWMDSSGVIALEKDLTVVSGGYYRVTVFDDQGCSTSIDSIFVNSSSTSAFNRNLSHLIRVWPTLSEGNINMDLPGQASRFQTRLFSSSGQLIRTWNMTSGYNQIKLDHITSGMYFIQIIGSDGFAIKNIIKK